MIKSKFAKIIQKNILIIVLLANFLFDKIQSYYIFPFKILKPDLTQLSLELPNQSQEEIYLSYLNRVTLYTLVPQGNSKIYELIFKIGEKCSFPSNNSCISDYNNNIFSKFSHDNINISNIIDTITDSTKTKDKCTDIQIGLAMPGYAGKEKCVSILKEIKNNDIHTTTKSYSFHFYDEKKKKEKNFDGELLLGTEPHSVSGSNYNQSDYFTIYNYVDDYYYPPEGEETEKDWDGKYINFSMSFSKIFYYINNSVSPENIKYIGSELSNQGSIDFEIGLIKCPFGQYILTKQNFFWDYMNDNICKEIVLWGGYYGIICDKKKINTKKLYKDFTTLYFYNVNFNYTFTLTSDDLFIEKDDTIYFALISKNDVLNIWRFGHIFLKKYYLTLDLDKKSIGFYITDREREKESGKVDPNKEKSDDKNKTLSSGYIILFVGIALLIVEIISAVICIKKCNCINRKKRANELMDDNYDYTANVNSEEDKIIN